MMDGFRPRTFVRVQKAWRNRKSRLCNVDQRKCGPAFDWQIELPELPRSTSRSILHWLSRLWHRADLVLCSFAGIYLVRLIADVFNVTIGQEGCRPVAAISTLGNSLSGSATWSRNRYITQEVCHGISLA